MTVRFDLRPGSFDIARMRFDGDALIVPATPVPYDVVFDYGTARELRPKSEVTDAASLETWPGLPVILGHEWITSANVRDKAVGYVRQVEDGYDGWLHAELVITDASVAERLRRGDIAELSGGYSTNDEKAPGTFDGQHYDAIQRSIRMNHLGLGPAGWARGGRDARVR